MRRTRLRAVDDRAIEGLPVRLVIAVVVGVASLSVMMALVDDVGDIGATEVDVEPDPSVIVAEDGSQQVTLTVVEADGTPVEDATVIVRGDTATLDGQSFKRGTTSEDGTATVSLNPGLSSNQAEGTLDVEVKPPAGDGYTDRRENTEILVVEED
ncbi:Ig domain-containing protein group 1 domain-containing protein [Halobacteriales archaeon SW_12_71_31]|jgi:hypothetical protein|nr:MAG: Ig domain-containing protein group 1 domain-containing protein [Halobacteriales archaeon SW_12_71_31]